MNRHILTSFIAASIVASMLSACGHDSPSERTAAVTRPGESSGQRPAIGESGSQDAWLDDDSWRVTGPGLSLRYDRGGILFVTSADGAVNVHDLDGTAEVRIVRGVENADSTLSGAEVTVNGSMLGISEIKMMRRGEGRIWYRATDSSAGIWTIVIPSVSADM